MIKSLFVAVISLLALNALARTIESSINDLMSRFDMPELESINDEKELYWFVDRDHIMDHAFFYNSLMSELNNPKSFPHSRQIIAKCGLRKYLTMSESDQALISQTAFVTCIITLVKGGNFGALFELVIKFESKMLNLLDVVDVSCIKQLTEAFLAFSEREQFMDVMVRHNLVTGFMTYLFAQLIISNAPESFYLDRLTSRLNWLIASSSIAIAHYESSDPIDVAAIKKVCDHLVATRNTEYEPITHPINEAVRVLSSPDDITMADLGINFAEFLETDALKKHLFMLNAARYGKDVLLREAFSTLNDQEIIAFTEMAFSRSKQIKNIGLNIAVKIYNMIPESIRGVIHESESYLQTAIQWLKLYSIEELAGDENYSHKMNFKADPEQIAAGLLEEMVYYHRRNRIYSQSNYAFELKFNSPESFANFISQNGRFIFPQIRESNLPTSRDTLQLLAANESMRFVLAQSNLKILVPVVDLIKHIQESSIENIPKIVIVGSANFAKIEKFTDKSIFVVINEALTALMRPATEADYFKVRNALVYLINGPDRLGVNELPDTIKYIIAQEFTEIKEQLIF